MQQFQQMPLFDLGLDMQLAREVQTRIMAAKLANNTIVNYRSGWRMFERWCLQAGYSSQPAVPQTCIDFASWCIAEGLRLETVHLRLKAINYHHREHNLALPYDGSVRQFFRNAKRALCERPQGKIPVSPAQLRRLSQALHTGIAIDTRNRAIVLLCFASGWRRSELVSLDLRDVRWVPEGIEMWLGKSKTDQEGTGRLVGVQYGDNPLTCPVKALDAWIEVRGRWAGPLFTQFAPHRRMMRERLAPNAVSQILKHALERIGEDPTSFGAHSLRSGMITAAIKAGATETAVMQRTGHKSYEMMRRYVRPATVFRSNPLKGVL